MDRRAGVTLARHLHQARLVVFDEATSIVASWNGSATFNAWYAPDGEEVEVWTAYVDTPEEARQVIDDRLATYR